MKKNIHVLTVNKMDFTVQTLENCIRVFSPDYIGVIIELPMDSIVNNYNGSIKEAINSTINSIISMVE